MDLYGLYIDVILFVNSGGAPLIWTRTRKKRASLIVMCPQFRGKVWHFLDMKVLDNVICNV